MATRQRTTGRTNPSRPRAIAQPVYEDSSPCQIGGFMKENLNVSTEGKNIIRVRGERSVTGNKWHRVLEEYRAPDYCNVQATRAEFEGGILTITVPRKANIPIGPIIEAKPSQEEASVAPQKAKTEPVPQKKGKDEKPPTTSGEKQKDKESSEALASENARLEESEHAKQDGGTGESSEAKDKPEKPEIPEMKAEAESRGPCLSDRVENVTGKMDKESKLDKDGAGFAHADKEEYAEPKPNQPGPTTAAGTSSFRPEKYKQSLKGLMERDDEKQMLVNVGIGVAVLVIVALGTYAVYRSRK